MMHQLDGLQLQSKPDWAMINQSVVEVDSPDEMIQDRGIISIWVN